MAHLRMTRNSKACHRHKVQHATTLAASRDRIHYCEAFREGSARVVRAQSTACPASSEAER